MPLLHSQIIYISSVHHLTEAVQGNIVESEFTSRQHYNIISLWLANYGSSQVPLPHQLTLVSWKDLWWPHVKRGWPLGVSVTGGPWQGTLTSHLWPHHLNRHRRVKQSSFMNVKKQYNIWGIGNGADNYIDGSNNLLKLIHPIISFWNIYIFLIIKI